MKKIDKSCLYPAEPISVSDRDMVYYQNIDRDVQNAPDFFHVKGRDTYRSLDPRLIDVVRNIHMELDRPPLQPRNVQPLQHMYDDESKLKIQAGVYLDGYPSIYGGDVQYYIDPSMAQAYDSPVYVLRSSVVPFVFQDPMGALKPQYDRVPLYQNNTSVAEYSFDQDQMSFREDLISRQSRLMNQSDYVMYTAHFPSSSINTTPTFSSSPSYPYVSR